jgi:hypothetical protein
MAVGAGHNAWESRLLDNSDVIAGTRVRQFSHPYTNAAVGLFRYRFEKSATGHSLGSRDDRRRFPVQETGILVATRRAYRVLLASMVARSRLPAVLVFGQLRVNVCGQ